MQRIADLPFERASTHAAVIFHMTNHRFDGLAPLHPAPLRPGQLLGLVAMKHFDAFDRPSAIAQVDDRHLGLALRQDLDLFQLLCQRIAVIGIAREASGTDDQAWFCRDIQAHLDAEFVMVSRLALADALDFGRVQRILLLLVLRALPMQALSAVDLQNHLRARAFVDRRQLASNVADHGSQQRPLASRHPPQPLELLGMRVTRGAPPQRSALALVALTEFQPMVTCELDQLDPGHLQQPAVGGMCNGRFLHRRIHDHAVQLARLHRPHRLRCRNRLSQQLLDASLSQSLAPAHKQVGSQGSRVWKNTSPVKKLPARVLKPALADRFVGQVVRVLQIQQASHSRIGSAGRPSAAGVGGSVLSSERSSAAHGKRSASLINGWRRSI